MTVFLGTVPDMARKALEEGTNAYRAAAATRLTQLRSVLNGNQAAVARLLGVGTNTWNRYEKGVRDIDLFVLSRFCKAFGVSADWIILGDLYSLPKEVIAQMVLAYPEVARGQNRGQNSDGPEPPKRRLSSGMPALVAQR